MKEPFIEIREGMLGLYVVKIDPDTLEVIDFGTRRFISLTEADAYANRWAIRENLEYRR